MDDNFNACLRHVLRWEGGLVDHSKDPGGRTKYGIADLSDGVADHMADLDRDGRPDVKIEDLTLDDAAAYYRRWYWEPTRCDALPAGLDLAVFDFAVNSGVKRAAIYLQRIVGAKADGDIGGRTLQAVDLFVAKNSLERLVREYNDLRETFYHAVVHRVTREPLFPVFGKGWMARLDSTRLIAGSMLPGPHL